MNLQRVLRAWVATPLLFASSMGCDGSTATPPPTPRPIDAASGAVDAGMIDGSTPPSDATPAPPFEAAVGTEPETRTEELPRTPADPKLTRRLFPAPATLLGGDASSCSHEPSATTDRWCAVGRKTADGKDELWAINVSKAAAADIVCDGTSPHCQRLSAELWTGTAIWGPSHPSAHRFEDDTLIFHTGQPRDGVALHEVTIWAWRPEWPAPRKLTSEKGVLCFSQPHTRAAVCVENAVVDKDPESPFDRPRLREFDLLAGSLDAAAAPLARVARVVNGGGQAASRLRLTTSGEYLAFSRAPQAGAPELVEMIKVADAGKVVPVVVATGAAEWDLAHDGTKLYYLAGYDRRLGDKATGTLMLADFPSGANATELAKNVYAYELLGSHDEVVSKVDRGVAFLYGPPGLAPSFALMRDRTKPAEVSAFNPGWSVAQVATDVRHTLYFRELRNSEFPVAFVARNDGSGSCQLTSDAKAETYGGHFSDSGRSVFWIEFGPRGSQSEEGWYARPEDCGDRTKFGDFVFRYRLVGEDFVVFEGGDLDDNTSWLQYTPLKPSAAAPPGLPSVLKERPDPTFDVFHAGPGAKDTYVVFSTSQGAAADQGLYLHGPLRAAAP